MGKLRKIECPNPKCKKINEVDVEKELMEHRQPVFRHVRSRPMELPEFITVACKECGEEFQVQVRVQG